MFHKSENEVYKKKEPEVDEEEAEGGNVFEKALIHTCYGQGNRAILPSSVVKI